MWSRAVIAVLVVAALALVPSVARGDDAVDVFLARCSPGMTKGQVDRLVAEIGRGRWVSLSNTLKFDGEHSADIVAVSPWEHLELVYRPDGDASMGNLALTDPLVEARPHRFVELLAGMPADTAELLTAIQGVSTIWNPGRFDPIALLRCTNLLRRAGEAGAVSALERYLHLVDVPPGAPIDHVRATGHRAWAFGIDDERVILCARVLYGDGIALRPPALGAPDVELTEGEAPIFPLLLEGDLPFLAINGYCLGGLPEPASMHLDTCRRTGRFRASDLVAPASPVAVFDALLASPHWTRLIGDRAGVGKSVRDRLRCQAIRCLRDVVPQLDPEAYLSTACCGGEEQAQAAWTQIEASVIAADVHWDSDHQRYVAGTTPAASRER